MAVAVGVPPSKPLHILAIPWPKVSLLLTCLTPVRLSDIIHVNKLSIMTKHASVKAGFINSANLSKFGICCPHCLPHQLRGTLEVHQEC